MGEKKMGTTEQEKQTLIMRDMMCLGGRVFRNNVGEYKVGDRYIRYGLCPGSSDIIGWTPVKITPEMVGTTLPVFTATTPRYVLGKRVKASALAVSVTS
jgi:hypothetical protein